MSECVCVWWLNVADSPTIQLHFDGGGILAGLPVCLCNIDKFGNHNQMKQ